MLSLSVSSATPFFFCTAEKISCWTPQRRPHYKSAPASKYLSGVFTRFSFIAKQKSKFTRWSSHGGVRRRRWRVSGAIDCVWLKFFDVELWLKQHHSSPACWQQTTADGRYSSTLTGFMAEFPNALISMIHNSKQMFRLIVWKYTQVTWCKNISLLFQLNPCFCLQDGEYERIYQTDDMTPINASTMPSSLFSLAVQPLHFLLQGPFFSVAHLISFCELPLKHALSVKRDGADTAARVPRAGQFSLLLYRQLRRVISKTSERISNR